MIMRKSLPLTLLPLALLSACASSAPNRPAAHSCAELSASRVAAEQSRREAVAQQHDSWHAVIPVFVAGSYVSAHSKAAAAERRLAEIDGELSRKGCLRAAL